MNQKITTTKAKLYIVATPIGNREDITLRALRILKDVDYIAAEDTRHTRKLLAFHNIKTPMNAYHEHNEIKIIPKFIEDLKKGSLIALVTDAGTPSVSDPGYRLIRAAIKEKIDVIPIPGASAAITALSASGLPTDSFVFLGFLAKRKNKRLKQLEKLVGESKTLIFYESPKRIITLLEDIISIIGNRRGVLCREMTKMHEEFIRGTLSDIADILKNKPKVKGECTLIISGCDSDQKIPMERIRQEITKRLGPNQFGLSRIAKGLAIEYGISRTIVYNEALKMGITSDKGHGRKDT